MASEEKTVAVKVATQGTLHKRLNSNLLQKMFTPNQSMTGGEWRTITIATMVIFLVGWQFFPQNIFPTLSDVVATIPDLWNDGLLAGLYLSLVVQIESILIAFAVSLLLAYTTVLPAFQPAIVLISKWRFIGLAALVVFFSQMTNGGNLKILLLVIGVSVFYLTSMIQVIANIPREEFDDARTLGYNEWEVTWEVVVRGKIDVALEMLRQNAAMAWGMLTMVEGLVRSGGGIGTMILNDQRHFRLANIIAIIVLLLAVGFLQDVCISWIRIQLCPYADLEKTRR